MSKIAICDWGIGGLGFYKSLREDLRSSVDVIYFSDAGFMPYGKVSKEALKARWQKVRSFLLNKEVDLIVVACNALSTVVSEEDTISIATAVKKLVQEHKDEKVVVLGGKRTIESKIYDLGFRNHSGIIAQPLSALVERGVIEGNEVKEQVSQILSSLNKQDKVILACTHYPVLIPVMQELHPGVAFFDPVGELLPQMKEHLEGNDRSEFYTTGDVNQMKYSAGTAFGVSITEIISLDLNL